LKCFLSKLTFSFDLFPVSYYVDLFGEYIFSAGDCGQLQEFKR